MSKNKSKQLLKELELKDPEEFNELKRIMLKMLKDDRIDYLIRDEYWNSITYLLFKEFDSQLKTTSDEDKFKITCKSCGSNNVSIREDIDYDYDEVPYVNGYYLECNNCEENNL